MSDMKSSTAKEILGQPDVTNVRWFNSDPCASKLQSSFLKTSDIGSLFAKLPELSGYTAIASPGILKRLIIGDMVFVLKSVPIAEISAQKNEITSSIFIRDCMNDHAPSPISIFGFDVEIVAPEAFFGTLDGRIVTVMQYHAFPTLDEILLTEANPSKKLKYLQDVRSLYDFFSSYGIFWKDMAPRNILVDRRNLTTRYIILDFEKTKLLEIDHVDEELAFWRGAVLSEEFVSSCGLSLVNRVFGDKFDPTQWDFADKEELHLSHIRREILAIVTFDGTEHLQRGEYNLLDRQLIKTREPFVRANGEICFPGKLCFFVDHIFGPEYDRKLNEIFLAAQYQDSLVETACEIDEAFNNAGIPIVRLVSRSNQLKTADNLDSIRSVIDDLYSKWVRDDRPISIFGSCLNMDERI